MPARGRCAEPIGSAGCCTSTSAPPDDLIYAPHAHRKRRGSRGGRPVIYDRNACRGRNVIERAFDGCKHWRGLATRYDKHASVYHGGLVLAAARSGSTT